MQLKQAGMLLAGLALLSVGTIGAALLSGSADIARRLTSGAP
ncbi:MAG: hypothetical protein U5K38_03995 [Woeseiaceae bacterium]|nr:hypothetical protein [Woeseiaceae bacterium]